MFSPPYPPSAAEEIASRMDNEAAAEHQNSPPKQSNEGHKLAYNDHRPFSPSRSEQPDAGCASATARHSKVRLVMTLDRPTFLAGDCISGRIEVASTASHKLRLGEIAVDLGGDEELRSRDHAASQRFLHSRVLFQGRGLPPSNAVIPSAPHQDYWTARKGRTTFPFSFPLAEDVPSAIEFAGNAAVRYSVTASVQLWYENSRTALVCTVRADVIEQWGDEHAPIYWQPVERVGEAKLLMGGQSGIWLEASLVRSLHLAGERVVVRVGVRNESKRDTTGVRIEVIRTLTFAAGGVGGLLHGPSLSEIAHAQHFRGSAFDFAAHSISVLSLPILLPSNLRTVRKTKLFNINISLVAILPLGSLAKDLELTLPVHVAHPDSIIDPPELHVPGRPVFLQTYDVDGSQEALNMRSTPAMEEFGLGLNRQPSPSVSYSAQAAPAPSIKQSFFAALGLNEALHVPHHASPVTFEQYGPGEGGDPPVFACLPSQPRQQPDSTQEERSKPLSKSKPLPAPNLNETTTSTTKDNNEPTRVSSPQLWATPARSRVSSASYEIDGAKINSHVKSNTSKAEPGSADLRPRMGGRTISSKEIELFEEMVNDEGARQSSAHIMQPESRSPDDSARSEVATAGEGAFVREREDRAKGSEGNSRPIAAISRTAVDSVADFLCASQSIPTSLSEPRAVAVLPVESHPSQRTPSVASPSTPAKALIEDTVSVTMSTQRSNNTSRDLSALERRLASGVQRDLASTSLGSEGLQTDKEVLKHISHAVNSLKGMVAARGISKPAPNKLNGAAERQFVHRTAVGPDTRGRKGTVGKGEAAKLVKPPKPATIGIVRDPTESAHAAPSESTAVSAESETPPLKATSAAGASNGLSQRGGRGGRVTSVKALWTSLAEDSPSKLKFVTTAPAPARVRKRHDSPSGMHHRPPIAEHQSSNQTDDANDRKDQGALRLALGSAPAAVKPDSRTAAPQSGRTNEPQAKTAGATALPVRDSPVKKKEKAVPTPAERRAAPPLLNTTTPRVYLCSSASASASAGGGGAESGSAWRSPREAESARRAEGYRRAENRNEAQDQDGGEGEGEGEGEELRSVIGRGTTRVLGKQRMHELRSLWADNAKNR